MAALRAFEKHDLSQVDHSLPPGDRTPDFLDELRQVLRDKLFVGKDGTPPKIVDHSGRGSLHSWVRTAVVHTARSLHRTRRPDEVGAHNEAAVIALSSDENPELSYLKRKYR